MSKSYEPAPFATLGSKLKDLRQLMKETLAEAAGAVEIGEDDLQRIEEGKERPSEEILMLLINHFGMKEDDAVQLWELAGYDSSEDIDDEGGSDGANATKTVLMAIAMDPRVMYSDSVHVAGSKHGVVLSFMQPGGGNLPNMPVARIGMSREHAKKFVALLQETLGHLDAADPDNKQLPSGDADK